MPNLITTVIVLWLKHIGMSPDTEVTLPGYPFVIEKQWVPAKPGR